LLLDEIVTVISRDAVMRSILAYANIPRPSKKVKIPRQVYPRKTSVDLWDSILGKRIKTVREEIARIGVNHFSRDHFPFPLFEETVKECKDANIFTTGRKKATICDEFKVLACLRILGRNYATASIRELLGAAKTTINDFFKLFLVGYSRAFYK
jgi:hypothetical protein